MVDPSRVSDSETIDAGPRNEPAPEMPPPAPPLPASLGRYRILEKLGAGGFGMVFKAFDEELQRVVALEVPHRHRISRPEDVDMFLTEARILARLDHPAIVPVHDFGRTEDGLCYVVSKYIEGCDLKTRIKNARLALGEAVEIVARVAEAVHHAHQKGLVHRDIKPANILLDAAGNPYLADFGLALREEEFGKGPGRCGTAGYMSPEQARGEGHRVDARSDVYSLGVVLYELLLGRLPFSGTYTEIVEQTQSQEPRPPRQLNATVPRELDRICLKALALRASDRYSTGADLADDLRHWQMQPNISASAALTPPPQQPAVLASASSTSRPISHTEDRPIKIVPHGLRSFDEVDADFFLELLPGPRDRDGLPDSIRFWKTRIEETDPDRTFRVGLVYGPSGCGKSSLVKAGLLPRLNEGVLPVYLEATPEDTETRLLRSLRKRRPDIPVEVGLADALGWLRRTRGGAGGSKVLIVLDQFEQWLQARGKEESSELVQALRQCDGRFVQALVMVRDDFWMAATRFMRELEIRLVEGQNSAAVDLFDTRHARKVLAAYGHAFGALPEGKLAPDQENFLDQAVAGLSQGGKVISVHLSLVAEMIKGQPWTPATLHAVGGAEGIGVSFLEETFSAATAPPEHRLHQRAARAVLRVLLPEAGAVLKGHMRSDQELRAAADYVNRPEDFEELLNILDNQLRLVTPAEPEGPTPDATGQTNQRYYQLTHDYLVQLLREWLTRKQKETWRGRAALRLEERTALWSPTRQNRFLPSLPEFLSFWIGVPHGKWKPPESAMMRAAFQRHGLICGSIIVLLLATGLIVQQYISAARQEIAQQRAELRVQRLLKAPPADVPEALRDLMPYAHLVLPALRAQFANNAVDSSERLHAAFGLAHLGEAENDYLIDQLHLIPSSEARNLITALASGGDPVIEAVQRRFRAATDHQHQARLAIALLYLGDALAAQEMLTFRPDPARRTAFIHLFESWHGDVGPLPKLLKDNQDPAFQSGLCAAVGLIDPSTLGADDRREFEKILVHLYRLSPDKCTHGMSGWALRHWGLSLPALEESAAAIQGREWFVTGNNLTMLRIPPGRFSMGDPAITNAPPHKVTLTQTFFVSDREISVDLFQQFVDDASYPASEKPEKWIRPERTLTTSGNCAVSQVSWVDAVLFCNWLSIKERKRPCYRRGKQYVPGFAHIAEEEVWMCDFGANGYRLPTEAEWEYACRAGTVTPFYFGRDPKLVPKYAVHYLNSKNTVNLVGTRLPNDWGLFDMYGNVNEWCWDWYAPYAAGARQDPHGPQISEEARKVARGGHWLTINPNDLQSGNRGERGLPATRSPLNGLRVTLGDPDINAHP